MSRAAILMRTGGRPAITGAALLSLSLADGLEMVNVHLSDDGTGYDNDVSQSALNIIGSRTQLTMETMPRAGAGADRWRLLERHCLHYERVCLLDDDVLLPPHFLGASHGNLVAAFRRGDWGFTGHHGIDTLAPSDYSWQAVGAEHCGLLPAYAACGFCLWLNCQAVMECAPSLARSMAILPHGDDGALTLTLSARYPCYIAQQPAVYHLRGVAEVDYRRVRKIQCGTYAALQAEGVTGDGMRWFEAMMETTREKAAQHDA